MQFVDKTVIAGAKTRESDGAFVCDARVARTGIQFYLGREVDENNEHGMRDAKVVSVYRPGSEVFSEDTLRSAAHRPVTNNHPREMVSKDNWKSVAVGNTADEVSAEGIHIRVPLIVSDGDTIKDIENGKRELSAGYYSDLDWTPEVTPSGERYDAVQRNIRFNHIAVVQRGRAGKSVRIGDEAAVGDADVPENYGEDKGDRTMADMRKVTVDGISIEVTDQGAQVIERLQGQIKTLTDAASSDATKHKTEVESLNAKLAAKDAELDATKGKVLDAAGLDKLVAARAQLLSDARLVAKDVKTDGLDAAGIKRAAVTLALGDAAVKDKAEAYVDARFEILLEDARKNAPTDRFADVRSTTVAANDSAPAKAYTDMLKDVYGAPAAASQ